MVSKSLVITSDNSIDFRKDSNKDYYYYFIEIDNNRIEKKFKLNNFERLHQIAEELRSEYTNWIYMKNEIFIQNKLVFNNDLSLFFLTDLSCKRNDLFDTYQDICNIKFIIIGIFIWILN